MRFKIPSSATWNLNKLQRGAIANYKIISRQSLYQSNELATDVAYASAFINIYPKNSEKLRHGCGFRYKYEIQTNLTISRL